MVEQKTTLSRLLSSEPLPRIPQEADDWLDKYLRDLHIYLERLGIRFTGERMIESIRTETSGFVNKIVWNPDASYRLGEQVYWKGMAFVSQFNGNRGIEPDSEEGHIWWGKAPASERVTDVWARIDSVGQAVVSFEDWRGGYIATRDGYSWGEDVNEVVWDTPGDMYTDHYVGADYEYEFRVRDRRSYDGGAVVSLVIDGGTGNLRVICHEFTAQEPLNIRYWVWGSPTRSEPTHEGEDFDERLLVQHRSEILFRVEGEEDWEELKRHEDEPNDYYLVFTDAYEMGNAIGDSTRWFEAQEDDVTVGEVVFSTCQVVYDGTTYEAFNVEFPNEAPWQISFEMTEVGGTGTITCFLYAD